jgi:FkbM family methyltransferase
MIKKFIKRIFPKSIIDLNKKIITLLILKYYSRKFKPLIIRKNTTDFDVFRQIFVQRCHRLPIKIKPRLIIDVGAYTGLTTLYFHLKYPHSKIIAVEPEDSNFKILEKNIKNIKNIKRVHAGIWYKECFLRIVDKGLGKWGFITQEVKNKNRGSIKAITIDKILKESGFNEIDILKIDIEGSEKELFSKNYDWLNKVNILIIELHEWLIPECEKTFYEAIKKYKFRIIKRDDATILIKQK